MNKKASSPATLHGSHFFGQKFIGTPKVLILDTETSPSLGYTWGKYEQNVIEFEKDWTILSFAWKWLKKPVQVLSCRMMDEEMLLWELWLLLNEADILVGQNVDKFDIRKIYARFLIHGIPPPAPYMTIDTLKLARKHFMFDSNKLDDLGRQLGLGRKLKTHGKDTWLGAMRGDISEWKNMEKYNAQDVLLNEQVFLKMLPWLRSKPNRRKPIIAKHMLCIVCNYEQAVRGQTECQGCIDSRIDDRYS